MGNTISQSNEYQIQQRERREREERIEVLMDAIEKNELDKLDSLLHPYRLTSDILCLAIQKGNVRAVEILLTQDKHQYALNGSGEQRPIIEAYKLGNEEMINALLKAEVNVDYPLRKGLEDKDLKLVTFALKHEANTTMDMRIRSRFARRDKHGKRIPHIPNLPYQYAISEKQYDMAAILLATQLQREPQIFQEQIEKILSYPNPLKSLETILKVVQNSQKLELSSEFYERLSSSISGLNDEIANRIAIVDDDKKAENLALDFKSPDSIAILSEAKQKIKNLSETTKQELISVKDVIEDIKIQDHEKIKKLWGELDKKMPVLHRILFFQVEQHIKTRSLTIRPSTGDLGGKNWAASLKENPENPGKTR